MKKFAVVLAAIFGLSSLLLAADVKKEEAKKEPAKPAVEAAKEPAKDIKKEEKKEPAKDVKKEEKKEPVKK